MTKTKLSQPEHSVKMLLDQKVPMRDGVELSTDVYLPFGKGSFPVILERTPFGRNYQIHVEYAMENASRGYAVVTQDVRGRYDSQGEWYPFIHEAEDAYDAQEWAGTQPWSNGKVGTSGGFYLAVSEWQAAPLRNPHLVTMAPRISYSNFYHNWVYTGGAFQLDFSLLFALKEYSRVRSEHYLWMPESNHLSTLYRHLPINTMDKAAGISCQFFQDWLAHPTYDDYWKNLNPPDERYEDIDVPVFGIAGWFDVFQQGTLQNFRGLTQKGMTPKTRNNQRVLVGPWTHSLGNRGALTKIGDVDFGPEVQVDIFAEVLRWFDYWLKGIDNGVMEEPPVRVFVMGANRWRLADEWPIAGTEYVPYYLHSRGKANSLSGDGVLSTVGPSAEPADRFTYDPENPVPTLGGSTGPGEEYTPVPMGPRDQRPIETRPDVLVYSSEPLEKELEVTGPVKAVLYASTDARDTDFTAKLVDVYPSGFAMNVAQGIIRARYRDSWESPSLLDSGSTHQYNIDMWSTSVCFQKGHIIRLEVSSSNFPQFDRNPNTGHAFGVDAELQPAHQTVFHDSDHPSHILLPTLP